MLQHRLEAFDLPFVGLRLGKHIFTYEIDHTFFDAFDGSLIQSGDIYVHLTFDKRKEHFFVLELYIDGTVETDCDRCMDPVNVQINSQNRLIVKFKGTATAEEEDDPDVLVLDDQAVKLNLTKPIFDFIHLSMPLKKTCAMDAWGKKECNPAVMQHLQELREQKNADQGIDPRWEALKKLK